MYADPAACDAPASDAPALPAAKDRGGAVMELSAIAGAGPQLDGADAEGAPPATAVGDEGGAQPPPPLCGAVGGGSVADPLEGEGGGDDGEAGQQQQQQQQQQEAEDGLPTCEHAAAGTSGGAAEEGGGPADGAGEPAAGAAGGGGGEDEDRAGAYGEGDEDEDGEGYDPMELTKGKTRHLWLGNLNARLPRSALRQVRATDGLAPAVGAARCTPSCVRPAPKPGNTNVNIITINHPSLFLRYSRSTAPSRTWSPFPAACTPL